MITPPPNSAPPRLGPLPGPSEDELVAAARELRDQALTLPWAAAALGIQPARLLALARAGTMIVIPGPWPMRQAHASGLGYFVPAWQLGAAARAPHEALPALIEAAAERGWTSLDLHHVMTAPVTRDGRSPADLLRHGEAKRAIALVRGEPDPQSSEPETPNRHHFALRTLRHRQTRA